MIRRGRMVWRATAVVTAGLGAGWLLSAMAPATAVSAEVNKRLWTKAKPADAIFEWTGIYVGGHVGYGIGPLGRGSNPDLDYGVLLPATITGISSGVQAGYRTQLPSHWVVGVETDVSFSNAVDPTATKAAPFNTALDAVGSMKATVGYAYGRFLPYIAAGPAWGRTHLTIEDGNGAALVQRSHLHPGWTAATGLEFAITGPWSAKVEYQYVDLAGHAFLNEAAMPPSSNVAPHMHMITGGFNYRPWDTRASSDPRYTPNTEGSDWNLHLQTTFIEQAYPSFRSPYAGPNSLPGTRQGRETWTATAFVGWRLWSGGEFYFNPELAQGFGLAGTHGLVGFSNGEAQKGGAPIPRTRAQRYFFRQTFGLGGEQEHVSDGPNQLAGKRDIDRVTFTVGRLAVNDLFDGNSYAHDPRADFMNWALWESAAFDMPADLPGFTHGAVLEFNRKDWAIRGGVFQVPTEPNIDTLRFKTGSAIVELEERHTIFEQPGKLRLGAFLNRENAARFDDIFRAIAADPSVDINAATAASRRQTNRYGFYANLEQQVMKDVGVFARASWNDGRSESVSFTDVDHSLAGGVSIKGSHWGRADDTIGLGGAINGLTAEHRTFFANGGLGLLIGDGRLNYHPEQIMEAYYAWAVRKGFTWTFDYQFVANPAYNADRGPASIFSTRLHGEW